MLQIILLIIAQIFIADAVFAYKEDVSTLALVSPFEGGEVQTPSRNGGEVVVTPQRTRHRSKSEFVKGSPFPEFLPPRKRRGSGKSVTKSIADSFLKEGGKDTSRGFVRRSKQRLFDFSIADDIEKKDGLGNNKSFNMSFGSDVGLGDSRRFVFCGGPKQEVFMGFGGFGVFGGGSVGFSDSVDSSSREEEIKKKEEEEGEHQEENLEEDDLDEDGNISVDLGALLGLEELEQLEAVEKTEEEESEKKIEPKVVKKISTERGTDGKTYKVTRTFVDGKVVSIEKKVVLGKKRRKVTRITTVTTQQTKECCAILFPIPARPLSLGEEPITIEKIQKIFNSAKRENEEKWKMFIDETGKKYLKKGDKKIVLREVQNSNEHLEPLEKNYINKDGEKIIDLYPSISSALVKSVVAWGSFQLDGREWSRFQELLSEKPKIFNGKEVGSAAIWMEKQTQGWAVERDDLLANVKQYLGENFGQEILRRFEENTDILNRAFNKLSEEKKELFKEKIRNGEDIISFLELEGILAPEAAKTLDDNLCYMLAA